MPSGSGAEGDWLDAQGSEERILSTREGNIILYLSLVMGLDRDGIDELLTALFRKGAKLVKFVLFPIVCIPHNELL
jgi:hypothetical protein